MLLYLLRHGIAESHAPSGLDADRRLTQEGRTKTRKIVAELALRADKPDLILTSPLIRARQTAELAGEAFDVPIEVWDVLGNNHADEILTALPALVRQRDESALMLVGHEPSLSGLIERLVNVMPPGGVRLKKAGCAALEVSFAGDAAASALLLWLTTPKMLL